MSRRKPGIVSTKRRVNRAWLEAAASALLGLLVERSDVTAIEVGVPNVRGSR